LANRRVKPKGIFCLEGDWWGKVHQRASVRPALDLLNQWDPYYIPYQYHDVATRDEFDHYVAKWRQNRFRDYPILYLAFHGAPGILSVGDRRSSRNNVTLDELAEQLKGACHRRIIHFGSCGILSLHGNYLNSFVRRTHALAICGFSDNVLWLESTAFELQVFAAMQLNTMTKSGAIAMRRRIRSQHGDAAKGFGFRMLVRP
jgi:hypothetical protein